MTYRAVSEEILCQSHKLAAWLFGKETCSWWEFSFKHTRASPSTFPGALNRIIHCLSHPAFPQLFYTNGKFGVVSSLKFLSWGPKGFWFVMFCTVMGKRRQTLLKSKHQLLASVGPAPLVRCFLGCTQAGGWCNFSFNIVLVRSKVWKLAGYCWRQHIDFYFLIMTLLC